MKKKFSIDEIIILVTTGIFGAALIIALIILDGLDQIF